MKRLRHPIRAIREPFGTAGLIVAMVALVAALGGSALAAKGALTGKQKKEVEKIAKKYAGKPGAEGKAGAAGPQGPAGANGKDGANGTNGTNGVEGAKGATGATGKNGTNGLEGPAGPTGPTGTYGGIELPEGVTETGYWAFSAAGTQEIKDGDGNMVTIGSSEIFAPISFQNKVTATNIVVRYQTTDPEFETTCGQGEGGAGGNVNHPTAPPATLCVWQFSVENATLAGICRNLFCEISAIADTGAYLKFTASGEGPAHGAGSWALTG